MKTWIKILVTILIFSLEIWGGIELINLMVSGLTGNAYIIAKIGLSLILSVVICFSSLWTTVGFIVLLDKHLT